MTDQYEDLLLSITSKYDKKKSNLNIIETSEKDDKQTPLTIDEENSLLFRYILDKKSDKWKFAYLFDGTRNVSAYKNKEFEVLYYTKDNVNPAKWVIKKDGKFIARIIGKKLNLYRFGMKAESLRCINLGKDLKEQIANTLVKKDYCYFNLNYSGALECVDELFTIGKRSKNDIV